MNDLLCPRCGNAAATGVVYPPRCPCGSLWQAAGDSGSPPGTGAEPRPLWSDPGERDLVWKREDLNPTGSFKDRGAEALMAVALRGGARRLVLDSSGSAALAAARVAAREGIPLRIHAPETLHPIKRSCLAVLGAELVAGGDRTAATRRAAAEAGEAFWFSHVMHPAFCRGTGASAVEVLAARRREPVWMIPVGNGSLLLGAAAALDRAQERRRLVAVQTEACPGLVRPGRPARPTPAHGIAVPDPPRRTEVLEAVERFGGTVLVVSESRIAAATAALGSRGVRAEAAAAAALAGLWTLREREGPVAAVAWLTGSGSRE